MAEFDWSFPYPSQRMPVLAENVVATSQPLAAQAGLRMLLDGGNATDAALAAAIALTVVEPTSNGIGSDAFAIVWDGERLHGLNASGRSPAALTPGHFAGRTSIPRRGWDPVTVPGAVSAWAELSQRFGRLPFERLFEPAIRYAADGYPVSPIIGRGWQGAAKTFADFPAFLETFCPDGRAPNPGERFRSPDHARTLREIAETNGESLYRGELARRIADHAAETGGLLTADDLAAHTADPVEPISVGYRGLALHEIPPNGQGIAALIALGILANRPVDDFPVDSADSLHVQIEAMKLAFADAHRHVADPGHMELSPADLLAPDYLAERAGLIDMARAGEPTFGLPRGRDTVYLTAADAAGMMVSFIQSNYYGFGSGVVIPGTGIALQNRGLGFTLEPGHPNQVGPGKRPYHTIIPAFITRGGEPVASFGVMGGPMQPQGHVQLVVRLADHRQNPQAAIDAPRWRVQTGRQVLLERGTSGEVIDELRSRGHEVEMAGPAAFGGAQFIGRLDGGGYLAASEPRKDGQAVGW
ncbi:MAG: gamma-glutamyltransferase family protein [Planctomycetota bacterium]